MNRQGECGVYLGEDSELSVDPVSGGIDKDKASSATIFKQLTPDELSARIADDDSGVKITGLDEDGNPSTTDYLKNVSNKNLENDHYVPPGGVYIKNDSISKVEFYNPGEYLVVLFKDGNYQGDCEVLTSTTDLSTHDIGRCWYVTGCPCTTILGISWCPPCYRSCVSSFKIIPIKAAASAITLPPPPPPPPPTGTCSCLADGSSGGCMLDVNNCSGGSSPICDYSGSPCGCTCTP